MFLLELKCIKIFSENDGKLPENSLVRQPYGRLQKTEVVELHSRSQERKKNN